MSEKAAEKLADKTEKIYMEKLTEQVKFDL